MLSTYLQNIPHLNLKKNLPDECITELLSVKDFYGLKLKSHFPKEIKDRYYNTSKGHALKTYSGKKEHAYYTPNSNAIDLDVEYFQQDQYFFTDTWSSLKKTKKWITKNICSEENLCMVCLHLMAENSFVDWHSHYNTTDSYDVGIVHISITTSPEDLSEVKQNENVIQQHYPKGECWLFNSWLEHRSINKGNTSRLHLVLECKFIDNIFNKTIMDCLGYV